LPEDAVKNWLLTVSEGRKAFENRCRQVLMSRS